MQQSTRKNSLLATAVVAAMGLSAQAGAQMLEEVVVTAQKKAEGLTEAPVAVSLVSGQDINDLSIFQADELNKLVTGMEIRYEGDSNTGVGLRGVGTFQQQSAPARVGTYLDDFYMASQAATALASMFDMANVQVLKGPQGTLYGQPSPTGALILTSADPNFDGINGHIQGSVTDPSGYNVQGAINFPIGDSFALRIAGLLDERETGTEVKRYAPNPLKGLDEERNREGIRIKALWEPTDNFSAKLGYLYMETNDSDTYRIVETIDTDTANFDLDADDRIAIADNQSELLSKEDSLVTLHLNWAVGDLDLQWFSGWQESIQEFVDDADATDIPSVILLQETDFGKSGKTFQHEFKVTGTAFDFWEWTGGFYYADADSFSDVLAYQQITGVGVFPFALDIPIESTTSAIFTHNTFTLSESWDLVVGLRYNRFEQDAGNVQQGDFWFGSEILPGGEITDPVFILENALPCVEDNNPDTPQCELGESYDEKEWTGTAKLSYYHSDELNMYATLDRGYRPGAANFDTSGVFTPDFNTYGGESVNSFELGAKGELFEGSARYTAAFFYSAYEDYQAQVAFEAHNLVTGGNETPTNAPWVNVDEAVQWGVEADYRQMVTDNWMIYGGFSYSNVEFTDGEVPCTDPSQPPVGPDNRFNTCDADGEVASAQPEWTAILQTEYTFPQLMFGADGYVGALANYRGDIEVPGDAEGRLESDGFATVDLFTGLRADSWTLQFFAKNITDDDGILSRRPLDFGYNELTVTPARTYGITASYNF